MNGFHLFWDKQVDLLTVALDWALHGADDEPIRLMAFSQDFDTDDLGNGDHFLPRYLTWFYPPPRGLGRYSLASIPTKLLENRGYLLRFSMPDGALRHLSGRLGTSVAPQVGVATGESELWYIAQGAEGPELRIKPELYLLPETESTAQYSGFGDAQAIFQRDEPATDWAAAHDLYRAARNGKSLGPTYHAVGLEEAVKVSVRMVNDGEYRGIELELPPSYEGEGFEVSYGIIDYEELCSREGERPEVAPHSLRTNVRVWREYDEHDRLRPILLDLDWRDVRPLSRVLLTSSPQGSETNTLAQSAQETRPIVFGFGANRDGVQTFCDRLFAAAYYVTHLVPDRALGSRYPVGEHSSRSVDSRRYDWAMALPDFREHVPRSGEVTSYTPISLYAYRFALAVFAEAAYSDATLAPSFHAFVENPAAPILAARMRGLGVQEAALAWRLDAVVRALFLDDDLLQASRLTHDKLAEWKSLFDELGGEPMIALDLADEPDVLARVVWASIYPPKEDYRRFHDQLRQYAAGRAAKAKFLNLAELADDAFVLNGELASLDVLEEDLSRAVQIGRSIVRQVQSALKDLPTGVTKMFGEAADDRYGFCRSLLQLSLTTDPEAPEALTNGKVRRALEDLAAGDEFARRMAEALATVFLQIDAFLRAFQALPEEAMADPKRWPELPVFIAEVNGLEEPQPHPTFIDYRGFARLLIGLKQWLEPAGRVSYDVFDGAIMLVHDELQRQRRDDGKGSSEP